MTELRPQTDVILRYLKDFFPTGPWAVTAIHTDRSGPVTRTFGPDTADEMLEWVVAKNLDNHNIYYHVGIPNKRLEGNNAQLGDIASVLWLHVDIDPSNDVDPEICRQQAISLLENGKDGIPKPTVVVDSGNGVQAFWRLTDYIKIDGNIEKAEDAKRYNQRLEVVFGADNCHNINRVMRLPGTVNFPNARKRRKGRVARMSSVVWFDKSLAYDLSLFPPLQAVQTQFSAGDDVELDIPANRAPVEIDDLDAYDVPDRTKVICVQGMHPDEVKEKDNSRSAWLFDALLKLVRCQVPDSMIYSIITDPDLGISASILDKQNADKEAKRQIRKAKEFAIDPQLVEMNKRHAVIRVWGGKCVVVEEMEDPVLGRSELVRTSFADIKNAYCNRLVEVGKDKDDNPVFKKLGAWWLDHPLRRQYDKLVFAPGRTIPNAYNLWRGFGVESIAGDCTPFLKHIRENLCDGVEEYYDYILRWMARAVQEPDKAGETAIVLRGDQGTGKSFFAKEFGALFGRHFLTVSNSKHLVGNFNAHLRDCVLLFGDEAFFAGDAKHESVLKTMVTDSMIPIESKGVDVETTRNYTHLILASNSEWVIPAGPVERRFFVLDVTNKERQNSEYFKKIAEQMEQGGGREALLHHLLTMDIKDWNVRSVPQTEALARQKVWSLDPMQEWWFTKLDTGCIHPDIPYWSGEVECSSFTEDYLEYTKGFGVQRRGNASKLGRFLKTVCPDMRRVQVVRLTEEKIEGRMEVTKKRPYIYEFPSLELCRYYWEEKMGKTFWSIQPEEEARVRHEYNDE